MSIYLGDLSLAQIQQRTKVDFPKELIDFMAENYQAEAANVKAGKWHCFDIPFILVCGDRPTAEKIYGYLKPLTKQFAVQMQIGLS